MLKYLNNMNLKNIDYFLNITQFLLFSIFLNLVSQFFWVAFPRK